MCKENFTEIENGLLHKKGILSGLSSFCSNVGWRMFFISHNLHSSSQLVKTYTWNATHTVNQPSAPIQNSTNSRGGLQLPGTRKPVIISRKK